MPYFIQTYDRPNSAETRQALRDEHLAYLASTKDLLIACGAKLGEGDAGATGSVYIVDVETREEAEAYIAGDPFAKGGLFGEVQIERWNKAYVNGQSYLGS